MNKSMHWLGYIAALVVMVFGTTGCITRAVNSFASGNVTKPQFLFEDEIFAIGRPDAELAKKLGGEHVVAFLGIKHTYLLYRGGEVLESIAQLNLDKQSIQLVGGPGFSLLNYKDNKVWGRVILRHTVRYEDERRPSLATIPDREKRELEELKKAGFEVMYRGGALGELPMYYTKTVYVEGSVQAPIHVSADMMTGLIDRKKVYFSSPSESDSTIVREAAGLPMRPAALVADIALTPVYMLGLSVLILAWH